VFFVEPQLQDRRYKVITNRYFYFN